MKESQAGSVAAAKSNAKAPTFRLVIRAQIIPEEAPRPPVRPRLNRRALALALGTVAVLTLSWVGIGALRTQQTPRPVASEPTSVEPLAQPATSTAEAESVASDVRDEPDRSPAPVNQVIPDVPRSALQTIRGTVRVSVRVTIDKQGTVVAATPEDPGPSRYFERLAVEASKKWTFAPAATEAQRRVLVRFSFTRAGATAGTEPPQ
jgi:TonB family protein